MNSSINSNQPLSYKQIEAIVGAQITDPIEDSILLEAASATGQENRLKGPVQRNNEIQILSAKMSELQTLLDQNPNNQQLQAWGQEKFNQHKQLIEKGTQQQQRTTEINTTARDTVSQFTFENLQLLSGGDIPLSMAFSIAEAMNVSTNTPLGIG